MRICFVTRFFPPVTSGGGIAAYTQYATKGLADQGHQVEVISMLASGLQSLQSNNGITIHRIPSPFSSNRWTRLPLVGRQIRFLRDIGYAARIRYRLLSLESVFKPDIVEYADIDAEGLFHPREIPYVVKLHASHAILKPYYSNNEVPYARRGIEWIEKKTIQKANGITSPSLDLANRVSRLMNISRQRITYMPNSINTDYYSPGNSEEEPNSVLFVGRLEPLKGAVVFSEAIPYIARRFPQARFIYLGADRANESGHSQKQSLIKYFAEKGLLHQVEFHGHANPDVFRKFYQRAAIVVIPSLYENCPYTLLEAMSCAKPCVVHKVGGMKEMIEDGISGLFFDQADPLALAEKVIELLSNPTLRASLGAAARQRVIEKNNLSTCARQVVNHYQSLLDR